MISGMGAAMSASVKDQRNLGAVPWTLDDDPDTLIYREEVQRWMDVHWGTRPHPCPVCNSDDWEAEGRLFAWPRIPPYTQLFRPVFRVRCKACSYMIAVNAATAGISFDAVFPDDLSGLDPDQAGGD
jgi:hypothetical protein